MAKINKDDLKIGVTFADCKDCDRVEVVRCKDCEHYGANKTYRHPYFEFAFCYKFHHNITTDNDFCSYGKRKEVANSG